MKSTSAITSPDAACTAQQAAAKALIQKGIISKENSVFILSGYAGTGKTFLIGQLVRHFQEFQRSFVLMAPTGRAAKVLARRTGVPAYTIHKTIYAMDDLKEYVEKGVNGSETYKFYFDLRNNDNDANTVYIVDEASMVPDHYSEAEFFRFGSGYLLADLVRYINFDNSDHKKKLIIVGDPAQLPPVGSNKSPALDPNYLKKQYGLSVDTFELTEVVRQRADSGIFDNATMIRNAIKAASLTSLDIRMDKPDVRPTRPEEILHRFVALGGEKPTDKAIIVALSNQQVNEYNKMVREHYFPGAVGPVHGDRFLVVTNNYQTGIALMNGDYISVEKVAHIHETRTITLKNKIRDKVVEKKIVLCFRDIVGVVGEDSLEPFRLNLTVIENILESRERELSSDEQKALYIDFRTRHKNLKPGTAEFKETIRSDKYFNAVRVKYGYAVTCHKAQGGEWPSVFVDFTANCGYFNLNYFRWAYTAITRARDVLYTLNEPHFTPITLQKGDKSGWVTHKVRNDLLVLSAALLENESVSALDEKYPFRKRIFLAAFSVLENSGIVIDGVEHHQYCEHYQFKRADERTRYMFHYNAKQLITRVLPANDGSENLSTDLGGLLSQLQGKYIVVEGDNGEEQAESSAVPPTLETRHEHILEAYRVLSERTREINIRIFRAKEISQYHLHCEFSRNGHITAIDYHFNAKGRLTRVLPVHSATTCQKLLQDVLTLSAQGCQQ